MSGTVEFPMEYRSTDEIKIVCCPHEWINVKDKLPLYKQCVLVYLDTETITEAVYRGEYEKNLHIFRLELTHEDTGERVSHWMPLPSVPIDKK